MKKPRRRNSAVEGIKEGASDFFGDMFGVMGIGPRKGSVKMGSMPYQRIFDNPKERKTR